MGRETRNFRQSGKSRSGNNSARNYQGVNRKGYWGKIVNLFKKGSYYGKG